MLTVAYPYPTQQAYSPLVAEVSLDHVLDGRVSPIPPQYLPSVRYTPARPASSATWVMQDAPASRCGGHFHLEPIADLYTVCDIDEDTLYCAEPPASYQTRSWRP